METRHWNYTLAAAAPLIAAIAGWLDPGWAMTITFLAIVAGTIHEGLAPRD